MYSIVLFCNIISKRRINYYYIYYYTEITTRRRLLAVSCAARSFPSSFAPEFPLQTGGGTPHTKRKNINNNTKEPARTNEHPPYGQGNVFPSSLPQEKILSNIGALCLQ